MKLLRARWALAMILVLLTAGSIPPVFSVQGASSQAQLETLIQVATSSRSYAITIIGAAEGQGLNVASSEALLSAGNDSLAIAQSDSSSNSNLTGGIQQARIAMDDFTNASTSASLLIKNSNTEIFLQISASLDSISSVNATAAQLATVIAVACGTRPTNSSYDSRFQEDCVTGKSYIGSATTDLKQASLLLALSETSQFPAGISQSGGLISDANGNLSLAATVILQLSQLSYSQRAQQYLAGPFAQTLSAANMTVSTQKNLVSNFSQALSSYQTFSSQQTIAIGGLESEASDTSGAASSATTAINGVSSSAISQQTTLSQTSTSMTELSAQIPSSLPTTIQTQLQTDISNVQAAISASSSSISGLETQVGSFNQVTLNSLSSYSSTFQTSVNAAESNNQALLTSFAALQTELNTVTIEFPLQILQTWQATLVTLGQSLNSVTSTLSSSSQTATTDLASVETASNSLQSAIQASPAHIEVSGALVTDISSIYSSESQYLNVTALAELQLSLTSIQRDAQISSSFVASAQSLFSTDMSELTNSVQALSSSGSSLETQATSTLTTMTTASAFLSSDLQIRSQALASANLDVSEALTMFDDLYISQGAGLLAQASVQLQIASEGA
jgi:hypothetical protein